MTENLLVPQTRRSAQRCFAKPGPITSDHGRLDPGSAAHHAAISARCAASGERGPDLASLRRKIPLSPCRSQQ